MSSDQPAFFHDERPSSIRLQGRRLRPLEPAPVGRVTLQDACLEAQQIQPPEPAGRAPAIGRPQSAGAVVHHLSEQRDRATARVVEPDRAPATLESIAVMVGPACVRAFLEILAAQIEAFRDLPIDDGALLSRKAQRLAEAARAHGYGRLASACLALDDALQSQRDLPTILRLTFRELEATQQAMADYLARDPCVAGSVS